MKKRLEVREREFLEACGFDMSYGFWSEDVEFWKRTNHRLYLKYVVNG